MSSKGILSESRRKIGNWLFNTRLTSSTYVHLHINKSAFESQISQYDETIIKCEETAGSIVPFC